jgi:hypothetical protein
LNCIYNFLRNAKDKVKYLEKILDAQIISIQCISGPVHRRGTPPNVVEVNGDTLIKLVKDPTHWEKLCHEGLISASGTKANLEDLFTKVSKLDTSSK